MTLAVERDLFTEYRYATGERRSELEDELVREHIGLAYTIAQTFVYLEDRESIALIGLLKAIRAFNPDEGFKFSTFAFPAIRRVLLNEVRRTKAEIRKADFNATSLEAPVRGEEDLRVMDTLIGDTPDFLERVVVKETAGHIRQAIKQLPVAQKETFMLSLQGLTYEEMAEVRGVTSSAIRAALMLARKGIRKQLQLVDPDMPVDWEGRGKRWTTGEKLELRKLILENVPRDDLYRKFAQRNPRSIDRMGSLIRNELTKEGLL